VAPRAGLCPAAAGLRPTAATGAGLTWIGPATGEPQVTRHAAPFIRKSSVWVKHRAIGPGRSSLRTEAAARRSQSTTWHIAGDWMVTAPAQTIRRRTCSLSFFSRRFSLSDFDGFLDIALRGDLSAMSAPFPLRPHYFSSAASGPGRREHRRHLGRRSTGTAPRDRADRSRHQRRRGCQTDAGVVDARRLLPVPRLPPAVPSESATTPPRLGAVAHLADFTGQLLTSRSTAGRYAAAGSPLDTADSWPRVTRYEAIRLVSQY
jgi:hypothetical protein